MFLIKLLIITGISHVWRSRRTSAVAKRHFLTWRFGEPAYHSEINFCQRGG